MNDISVIEIEDLSAMPDEGERDMWLDMARLEEPDAAVDRVDDLDLSVVEADMQDMSLDLSVDMGPDMLVLPACDAQSCDQISWVEGPALPVARDHHMTFLYGDAATGEAMLFVAGGFLQGSPPMFVDAVVGARVQPDGSLRAWEDQPSLPMALAGAPVIQRGQTIILPGGRVTTATGLSLTRSVWANTMSVEGLTGAWRELEELPVDRFHHASAQSISHVYLTGGLEINDATTTVHFARFNADDEPGAWQSTTAMPEPKTHHGSFIHGGYLYVTGGMNTGVRNPNLVATVWRAPIQVLSGSLGAWERYGELPEPLSTHAHTIYEGYVYAFGGITRAGFSDQVWRAALREQGELGVWEVLDGAQMTRTVGHTHHVPIWRDAFYVTSGGQRLTLTDQVSIGYLNVRR